MHCEKHKDCDTVDLEEYKEPAYRPLIPGFTQKNILTGEVEEPILQRKE